MRFSSIKKLGLCTGLLLSGCQAPISTNIQEQDQESVLFDLPENETYNWYGMYLDIPSEYRENLENWIEQQQVIKKQEVQYCDEIEYNYQICSHHTNITFYVNAFDPAQLEDKVETQYEQHNHYFYKIVFTPMYQCTLTSDMIQTVIQEMTKDMDQYMLFSLEEDFYQFVNQTVSYLPKEKVLKLG